MLGYRHGTGCELVAWYLQRHLQQPALLLCTGEIILRLFYERLEMIRPRGRTTTGTGTSYGSHHTVHTTMMLSSSPDGSQHNKMMLTSLALSLANHTKYSSA